MKGTGTLVLSVDPERRDVVMQFNRNEIETDAAGDGWIAFSPAQALNLARILTEKAHDAQQLQIADRAEPASEPR